MPPADWPEDARVRLPRSERRAFDYYPTPSEVVGALVARFGPALESSPAVLDPCAGEGHLLRALDEHPGCMLAGLSAIEIRPECREPLRKVVGGEPTIACGLSAEWPPEAVVMNPPFSLLDEFWAKACAHRQEYGEPVACLTPVAWWNASKRVGYTDPDLLVSLGWRPSFIADMGGPAHKGTQDFAWACLFPEPQSACQWVRVARDEAVGQEVLF